MVTRWKGTMLSITILSKWDGGMGTKCSTTSAIGLLIYIWWIEGNYNVVPQTNWAMNSSYNQWGGLVGDQNTIPQQKNYGNFGQSELRPSQFHHEGPQGTTYHVITEPNCGPNSRGVQGTLYPMLSTICGPNFIGPQGTTYTTTRPNCGPNFVGPLAQPYQVSPPPLISKGAHLLVVAPSPTHVPK
jgi:hypothetical protein